MGEAVQVAVVSFQPTDDPKENLVSVANYVQTAKERGAEWIFLPELWTHRAMQEDQFIKISKHVSDTMLISICELAKKFQVQIFAGTWTEASERPTKFYNTQYVIDANGVCVAKYRKIHLFCIQDEGKQGYSETKRYVPGNKTECFSQDGWNIGLSTCFDLRFSSFYEKLCKSAPLDLITVPSGFLARTGKYHWETLLRARAIEHQCYIVASNKVGAHEDPGIEKFFGHSMVIDPWGDVILNSGEDTGVFITTISKKRLQEVRNILPMREVKSCKTEVY